MLVLSLTLKLLLTLTLTLILTLLLTLLLTLTLTLTLAAPGGRENVQEKPCAACVFRNEMRKNRSRIELFLQKCTGNAAQNTGETLLKPGIVQHKPYRTRVTHGWFMEKSHRRMKLPCAVLMDCRAESSGK